MNRNSNLLIIEDDFNARDILKENLENLGFTRIDVAEDGEQGLKKILKNPVDLVLCDWMMPKLNGMELLQKIRQSEKYKSMPFIMITSIGEAEDIKLAIQNKVTDYIVKPIDVDVLEEKLARI